MILCSTAFLMISYKELKIPIPFSTILSLRSAIQKACCRGSLKLCANFKILRVRDSLLEVERRREENGQERDKISRSEFPETFKRSRRSLSKRRVSSFHCGFILTLRSRVFRESRLDGHARDRKKNLEGIVVSLVVRKGGESLHLSVQPWA